MWHSFRSVSLARLVRHCASAASSVAELILHYRERDLEKIIIEVVRRPF